MNPYIQELIQRIDNRYAIDNQDMSLGDWICANTHLRGRPFSFTRYPFQKAIADDLHPNMDVVKISQIGLSEVQIRKALGFLARNRGTNLIFTLPTDSMFERMASTRILPLAKDEKVFNLEGTSNDKPTRSKGLIQIGSSFMFVTGAKEGDATSIAADVVFNDEVDLTDQKMLSLFQSRMQASDWKISQRFSTPTFSGFGIDAGYQQSDQHEYMIKCDACNHWQAPTFTERFIRVPGLPSETPLEDITSELIDSGRIQLNEAHVVCEGCGAPLDLGRWEKREWVPKFGSRTHHRGYRIGPFSTDRLSVEYVISQMLIYRQKDYLRGWHNTVLGQPFTDGNAQLSDGDIARCFASPAVPDVNNRKPTWVGIDMGQTCHLILAQGETEHTLEPMLFKAIPVNDLMGELEIVLATYNVISGAVDRHPYTPTADAIFQMSKGKIWPVEYRGQKEINVLETHAQANRTQLLDAVAKMIRLRRVNFRGYGTQKETITTHLKDMVREEAPEVPANWVKLTGNDHYFHAFGFLLFALKLSEALNGKTDQRTSVVVQAIDMAATSLKSLGLRKG